MTKFTKEQLIDQAMNNIAVLRGAADRIPGASEAAVIHLRLAEITLTALTAEPVTSCLIEDGQMCLDGFGEYQHDLTDGEHQLYAAPPAPVVPDIGEIRVGRLPTMNQDDYPGLGDWWVQLRIGKDSDEVLARVYGATPQEANNRAEALAFRAALLQDAEPGQRDESPYDPQIASYEKIIEQAIPDGYALVPVDMAPEMMRAVQLNSELGGYAAANLSGAYSLFREFWDVAIAAAPQHEVK